ncbi:hypothetical protein GVAV_003132 [Gurleya vavrai]
MIILAFISLFSIKLSHLLINFFRRRIKLTGNDFHKKGNVILPEAIGIASGLSFTISLFLLLTTKEKNTLFINILAISASCLFTILLGFIDDVLDLEWRYKLIFPAISIIPTILLYSEGTKVLIPFFGLTNIYFFYYLYMIFFCTFTTNAINIFSGINGLEVSQILVLSFFLFVDNLLKLNETGTTVSILLFCCSLPLFFYNRYPAKVFVGDTFCYFGGMAISCISILCHTTRTLALLMIFQIINFLISLPQLLKIIHCLRHRMPDFDGKFLVPSYFVFKEKKIMNMTLLNLIIYLTGPIEEEELFKLVLNAQILWGGVIILVKYFIYNKL